MMKTYHILSQRWLLFLVFISGMCSLAVEMASSRLLENVFGSSNLVWASIIGMILIYLTVGTFLGGRQADLHPDPTRFYKILIWAGVAIILTPIISKPILRLAANAFDGLQVGVLLGSFVSVMILLAVPMILLGMTSPYAIRLSISDADSSGRISGKIYGISTIGSFIGTFLPTLVTIPLIGTYRTFVLFGLILSAAAWIALIKSSPTPRNAAYILLLILGIGMFVSGSSGSIKASAGQIYEAESSYNYIQVLQSNDVYMLRLNEGQGIHSVYSPTIQNFYGSWEQFMVAPFFNKPPFATDQVHSIAIVGLAAGTTARAATIAFGPIPIDGWEIDPKIVEVGREYFAMDEPNLNVIIQDGRYGLAHSDKTYSLVAIDAYRPPYIPAQLTTVEFFREVSDHLEENGVVAINVGRSPEDRELINDLATTMHAVFPGMYVMDIPNTFNSMLFATRQPTDEANLLQNLIYLSEQKDTSPLLLDTMQITLANLQDPPATTRIYTDDLSPVEWVTNNMVYQFLLSDDLSSLEQP